MSRIFAFFRSTALWILLLPYACTFLGVASNQAVIWANNDTFPVKANLVKIHDWTSHVDKETQQEESTAVVLPDGTIMLDDMHCVMTSKTHLNLLADIFDFHHETDSIGDLLIEFGDWLSGFSVFVWIAVAISRMQAKATA